MQNHIEQYEDSIKHQTLLKIAKQCIEQAQAIDDFATGALSATAVIAMLDVCINGNTCVQCDLERAMLSK